MSSGKEQTDKASGDNEGAERWKKLKEKVETRVGKEDPLLGRNDPKKPLSKDEQLSDVDRQIEIKFQELEELERKVKEARQQSRDPGEEVEERIRELKKQLRNAIAFREDFAKNKPVNPGAPAASLVGDDDLE